MESHLLQMRGLKPRITGKFTLEDIQVASFTDAWIETGVPKRTLHNWIVASFTDAWIETDGERSYVFISSSHLLQMRGLKLQRSYQHLKNHSRIFYRCVD